MASAQHRPARRNVVPPVNVVKLMDAVGPTRAAALVGVSTTLLHKAKKENEINQVVETASSYVLEHLHSPAGQLTTPHTAGVREETVFLIAVPADKVRVIERMAAALGADLVAA